MTQFEHMKLRCAPFPSRTCSVIECVLTCDGSLIYRNVVRLGPRALYGLANWEFPNDFSCNHGEADVL
ncbi:MAG: hypothetical protein JWM11_7690 [Planctomycetaceae bacterium]|nr:hypothetical protein [Planctomycetaceae bacterium]